MQPLPRPPVLVATGVDRVQVPVVGEVAEPCHELGPGVGGLVELGVVFHREQPVFGPERVHIVDHQRVGLVPAGVAGAVAAVVHHVLGLGAAGGGVHQTRPVANRAQPDPAFGVGALAHGTFVGVDPVPVRELRGGAFEGNAPSGFGVIQGGEGGHELGAFFGGGDAQGGQGAFGGGCRGHAGSQ